MHRLENPARLSELAPAETLTRLNLTNGMTFADIGAGTGIFTTAAAEITSAAVYAVDPSPAMQNALESKKSALNYEQIQILADITEVPTGSLDLALLCTVLHEIDAQEAFLSQIAERLKPSGRLAIIEFHKKQSSYGPPPAIRLSEEDTLRLAAAAALKETERFMLGENYYCVVFSRDQ